MYSMTWSRVGSEQELGGVMELQSCGVEGGGKQATQRGGRQEERQVVEEQLFRGAGKSRGKC